MADTFSKAQEAAEYIRHKTPIVPGVGSILGSRLGRFAPRLVAQASNSFLVEPL
jgi:hypothetical protein